MSDSRDYATPWQALDHFVNRVEELRLSRQALATAAGEALPVLNLFGVGGVGKTLLILRLRQIATEEHHALPFAIWDFLQGASQHVVLASLRLQLERCCNEAQFHAFDNVWYFLTQQPGDAAPAGPPLRRSLGELYKWIEPFAPLPAAGIRQNLAEVAAARSPLRHLLPQQLELELVRAFHAGLEALPARSDTACRGVIVFDTYEALTGPGQSDVTRLAALEEWIRPFCHELTRRGLLVVVAGRESLRWPPGEVTVEPMPVGNLLPHDAQDFLSRCGVGRPPAAGDPEDLQAAIIRCCAEGHDLRQGCLPFYLGLCAEIVHQERRGARLADPTPETFGDIPDEAVAVRLAERFLRGIEDDARRALLKELALPRLVDRELVAARCGGQGHVSRQTWRWLRSLSFFTAAGSEALQMHGIMRQALLAIMSGDEVRELHEEYRQHWEGRGNHREAWYHSLQLTPLEALQEWVRLAEQAEQDRAYTDARDLQTYFDSLVFPPENPPDGIPAADWATALLDVVCWLDEVRQHSLEQARPLALVIACIEAALRVRTEQEFPREWANAQDNLGIAHWSLPSGHRAENVRQAIACYEAALRVRTEQDFPQQWAGTQNNLGIAYQGLPSGDRTENLRQAIACYEAALRVCTEQDSPQQWARTQNNLGNAYADLPTGDRAANLRQAIACYEAALRVFTEEDFPRDWARTQNNLGTAYWSLPTGDRAVNLRRAIACYEAALRVYTEQDFPQDWAMTQNNLGTAYRNLPTGDRAENLRQAIACYEAALRVYTEEDFPEGWAMTKTNLGNAYRNLPTDVQADNLRQAIACYEAALRVRAEQDFPRNWAMTKTNLGEAYRNLPSGDRAANLRQAIACYGAALSVCTEQDFPQDWALTTENAAYVYLDEDMPGDRCQNLREAERLLLDALRVLTEEAFPHDHARAQHGLERVEEARREAGCP